MAMEQRLEHSEVIDAAARLAPPVAVSGLTLFGISMSEWVLLATLIYTIIQIYILLRDKVFNGKRSSKAE